MTALPDDYSRLDRLDGLGEPLPESAPIDHSPVWVMLALLASILFLVGAPSFFYLLAIGLWIVAVLNFWKEAHREQHRPRFTGK